jgi:hypothetical protein
LCEYISKYSEYVFNNSSTLNLILLNVVLIHIMLYGFAVLRFILLIRDKRAIDVISVGVLLHISAYCNKNVFKSLVTVVNSLS